MSALGYRTFKDRLFFWSVCFFASLTAIPLFLIIWEVVKKGYKQINLRFFVETAPSTLDAMLARNSGELIPGGIANGITGTLMMVAMASAIAIPVGILGGVYLAEKPKAVFTSVIRFLTDLVQGSPSIVIGIIAYSCKTLGQLFRHCRKYSTGHYDAPPDHPLHGRDIENAARKLKGSRTGTRLFVHQCCNKSIDSFGIRRLVYRHTTGHLPGYGRNSSSDADGLGQFRHQLGCTPTDKCSTAADLGILQRSQPD